MIKKIFSIVIGNFASKGVGFLREIFFASWFGTGQIATAFRIAQTAFSLPIQAFVGDSLGAGLLPLYKRMQQEGAEPPRILVMVASIYGLIFSAVTTTLLYLYAERISVFVAPGSSATALELSAKLIKIFAFAMPFYVLSSMLSYLETAYGQYGAIAWRPMLLNIGSLGGAAMAVWLGHTHWLATGIFLSHIVFFIWTLVQLHKLGGIWPSTSPTLPILKRVSARFLANLLPLLGLPLAAQINVLIERIVSSHLGSSVIPSVDYARFICDTSVQLVAVPLGILTMSMHGGTSGESIRTHISGITRTLLLFSFPVAVFIGTNAKGVVHLLYKRGAFNEDSVQTTASVLTWMGGALGMTITAYYLIKALNAQLRNKEALLITLLSVGANMMINLLLWRKLGPQTVGMAVAAYAFVLLTLCMTRLKLWREMLPILGWLAIGCLAQGALAQLVSTYIPYPYSFAINASIAISIWLSMILRIHLLRETAAPILSRIRWLNRFSA